MKNKQKVQILEDAIEAIASGSWASIHAYFDKHQLPYPHGELNERHVMLENIAYHAWDLTRDKERAIRDTS